MTAMNSCRSAGQGRCRCDRARRLSTAARARAPSARRAGTNLLFGVEDPLFAYQQLATHHRCRFTIPVVAVTGSNGKTTTKDMVASVLAQRWRTLKTEGNLNNRIGVPATLFQLTAASSSGRHRNGSGSARANHCACAKSPVRPSGSSPISDRIISNFSAAWKGRPKQRRNCWTNCRPDGAVVLNADDPYFDYLAARAQCRVISFGLSVEGRGTSRARRHAESAAGERVLAWFCPGKSPTRVSSSKVHGMHNVTNALAAAAVGFVLGLPGADDCRGIGRDSGPPPCGRRS